LKTGQSFIIGRGRVLPFVCADGSEKHFHLTVSEKRKEDKPIYWIGILTRLENLEVVSEVREKS
jgi:hypothetical protein